jgi:hypothetical protein
MQLKKAASNKKLTAGKCRFERYDKASVDKD